MVLPIRLHGVMLNWLSPGTTLPFYVYWIWGCECISTILHMFDERISGSRSVSIVRSQAQATEFVFLSFIMKEYKPKQ
jgi:hypothetical protein